MANIKLEIKEEELIKISKQEIAKTLGNEEVLEKLAGKILWILIRRLGDKRKKERPISKKKVPSKSKIGPSKPPEQHKEILTSEDVKKLLTGPDFKNICKQENTAKNCEEIYNILKNNYPSALNMPEILEKLGVGEASYSVKSEYGYPVKLLIDKKYIEKTTKKYLDREVPAYKWIKK